MTREQPRAGPYLAERVLSELPVAVVVADLNGKVVDCNARAHRLLGLREGIPRLVGLDDWQPRRGTLAQALRSVATSSSWVPLALRREGQEIELKGRGFLLGGHAEPRVLLLESHSAPHQFAEHSEQVRRLNAQLVIQRQTEDKLRAALRTAEDLRRELVHRVKNNLAIVSALLRTKARAAEHPAATEALTAAATRIRSIAIVHDILDARNESEVLTSKALFTALLDHLRISICPPHIVLESEIFDTELHTETALPLCLLVNELVTNAIKHAFSNRDAGRVRITFAEAEDGYHLGVADNGCGINETPARRGGGSRIVEALAQQLKGELEISRGGGTAWSITLHPSIRRDSSASSPAPPEAS
ncbi:two-component sensor histidine kinase [Limimaricola soesokkakensis]|uniref:histidine kinase n=1 Tax=Limimaricola soesokkakensis TaxID=1343159 RepID=A0A1X7A4Q3_9RHOB|nr:histidine kinase dimerization/phosphoacceptor domain -containing protein [Limimaricola soesokkakensis]PSK80660.1 two-component sensor histidine kinase [Limimaricola soesokkakensis]SLN70617.1 Blue-light-activated histidine kinase 2 [Limimaricola soesokkakensis]